MNTNPVDLFIGERIIAFRKKRELNQDQLAAALDISRQQLQKYETGSNRVPVALVAEISKILNIKTHDLLNGIDEIKREPFQYGGFVTEQRTQPLNILLVEDNATDELLTRKAIQNSEYLCNVVSVNDGAAALDYLRNDAKGINLNPLPDVIFLDLNIPRTRGEEVLKYVKTNNLFQHIPIIIITNSINREEMVRVYRLGASGFIVKSFDNHVYFEKIRNILSYWSMMVLPAM